MSNQKWIVSSASAAAVVILVGAGAYFVFAEKSGSITRQADASGRIMAFEEAVNNSDTDTAMGYFADIVYVSLEGSSCCGAVDAERATEAIESVSGLVFTFDPNAPVVKEYMAYIASQYPDRRLIGASPQFYFDELSIGVESDTAQANKASIGYKASDGAITDLFVSPGRDR